MTRYENSTTLGRRSRYLNIVVLLLLSIGSVVTTTVAQPRLDTSSVVFAVRGEHDTAAFGYGHLAFIGDVNGDGFDDLAVRRSYPDGLNIYFGGAEPDTAVDMFIRGRNGPPVSVDYDGDGIKDVLTVDELPGIPPIDGRLLVYKGYGDSLASTPIDSIVIPGQESEFCVRFEVADVNDDGIADYLLTSGYLDRFFLYLGPVDTTIPPQWSFDFADIGWARTVPSNESARQGFGFIDWDGDDTLDIYMGAVGRLDSIGYVWIFRGPDYSSQPDILFEAPAMDFPDIRVKDFGRLAANIGDVNDDGYDDLGVGFGSQGLVYFGGPEGDTLYDVRMESLAISMHNIGDFNDDGYSDLLMGRGQFYEGSADFHMGGPRFDGHVDDYINYLDLPSWFLMEIAQYAAGGGDFNGDGIPDVAIGCRNFYAMRGGVFVIAGSRGVTVPVQDEDHGALPESMNLQQNYPNPFNPSTTIQFALPVAGETSLTIYNVLGEEVITLIDKVLPAGYHSVGWDGRDVKGRAVSSGVYFYEIEIDGLSESRKMVLLR